MTEHPVDLSRYIGLVLESEASRDLVRQWFNCVRAKAPVGILTTIVADHAGTPKSASLIHRETSGGHLYAVPVVRDLTEGEGQRIVDAFAAECDLDFDVEITCMAANPSSPEAVGISIEQERYADVSRAWAKRQHEDWLRDRTNSGWRFGQVVSLKDRTHPLLRPWDELPERFRYTNLQQPQELLDLLTQKGYAVIPKNDLDSILKLVNALTK